MTIYLGADHNGFALKEYLKKVLKAEGRDVVDMGAREYDQKDDFPDFAKAVAERVIKDPMNAKGILICASGFGVDIAANKFKEIRSALAMLPEQIQLGRSDDDVNVLSLAADFVDEPMAEKIVSAFLRTPFDKNEERFLRRLKKIEEIESKD